MSISFSCPDCGKSYQVRDDLAGRRFKCKECARPLQVPSGIAPDDFFDDEPAERPTRRRQLPPRGGRPRPVSRTDRFKRKDRSPQSLFSDRRLVIIVICVSALVMTPMLCCCGLGIYVETQVKPKIEQRFADGTATLRGETNAVPFDDRKARLETRLSPRGPAPQEYEEVITPEGVEEVIYESEGRSLKAWIDRRGARGDRSPAIVYFHGGFAFDMRDLEACAPFRDAGYIILAPTVRGENGNPGDFELFLGEVDDAAAACRWLVSQDDVDPERVYTFGHSVGGGISAMLSLLPDVPVVCTASSGGLYSQDILFSWYDIIPFSVSKADEKSVRVLLGNIAYMRRLHIAYIGQSDSPFERSIQLARQEMKPDSQLKIERVAGDHFTSVEPAMQSYLEHIRSLAPSTAR